MKIDKTKLIQDIEEMRQKLASMEEELNKPEVFNHFPNVGDTYYVYCSNGATIELYSSNDNLLVNTYKTRIEAEKAYNKAVAVEKVKRRLVELQGDWKPDFKTPSNKFIIIYNHNKGFDYDLWGKIEHPTIIPHIKTRDIVFTIIDEMQDELKLIFDKEI